MILMTFRNISISKDQNVDDTSTVNRGGATGANKTKEKALQQDRKKKNEEEAYGQRKDLGTIPTWQSDKTHFVRKQSSRKKTMAMVV